MAEIKALTLTQPWATLVATGAKQFETRSWRTNYTGPLAIHAAKGFPRAAQARCFERYFVEALTAAGIVKPADLPRGEIIAIVNMDGCFATPGEGVPWREYYGGVHLPPPEPELAFGDYGPNRYAWRLRDVQRIKPFPWRGSLGLFNVDVPLLESREKENH